MEKLERIVWKENENAVELGFEFYLQLLEKRIKGKDISLVQELRKFFKNQLGISLRETQARGLMHKSSSIFIDYVETVAGENFNPTSEFWAAQGIDKFLEWKKKWEFLKKQEAVDLEIPAQEAEESAPKKSTTTITRTIRDNALSRFLKGVYDYQCQICTFTFLTPKGVHYAESHHIRPLGRKHNGIDKETNMLVLCPLHHAMFDFGAIAVEPKKRIILSIDEGVKEVGKKMALEKHKLNTDFLEYHLNYIYDKV
ncbi:MAG: HNH endonuclease [candidate division Zixibacteria bacterium]|nr:HNH endonuclease [candidate division Zixibacteria bacterium]